MRYVRAVYNTALKEHDLPVNPTVAVHWNKEERRQGENPIGVICRAPRVVACRASGF